MAAIPLMFYFEGDFVCKLVGTDTDHTMDQLAEEAKVFSVGIHVADQPGKKIRVRKQDTTEAYPGDLSIGDAGLEAMECLVMSFE